MSKYFLGIDNGGTYIKAALYDTKGNQISLAKKRNDVISSKIGYSEYSQKVLWDTNCECIKDVIEKSNINPQDILCIGISGQGCGFYAVDKNGEDIRNAITSSDQRSIGYAEKWEKNGTIDEVFCKIYRKPTAGHIITILAWLKENEPENYAKINNLFSMKDLLIYRLTGQVVAGYGCQSASCLMNMKTNEFDQTLSNSFGLPEMYGKFGDLKWDVDICGYVTEEAANKCGCSVGTPVCGGCHDVVAAIIAMGIADEEQCFMITGTHSINGYVSQNPVLNDSATSTELFAFPGQYMIEDSYPASSGTLEWVIDVLYDRSKSSIDDIYCDINKKVSSISPKETDLIFLPNLRGQRFNPKARGAWIGLLPMHTKAHMLRAVYESVVFSHYRQFENLLRGRDVPKAIRLAGGATNSDVWVQMFADTLGLPIELVENNEAGTKGAAIVASVASGMYQNIKSATNEMTRISKTILPDLEQHRIYEEKYKYYKEVTDLMNPVWKLQSKV